MTKFHRLTYRINDDEASEETIQLKASYPMLKLACKDGMKKVKIVVFMK